MTYPYSLRSAKVRLWIYGAAISVGLAGGFGTAQTVAQLSRERVLQQIENYAHEDVAAGLQLNDERAVGLFEDEGKEVGLTRLDISNAYRTRYLHDKAIAKHWWERLPSWLYILPLVLALVWRPFKSFAEDRLKAVYEALYENYAGAPLLRGRALARYRASIIRQHETFKMPFREAPLKMRQLYVPLQLSELNAETMVRASGALEGKSPDLAGRASGTTKSMPARHVIKEHERLVIKGIP